jgi:hypothetical protein
VIRQATGSFTAPLLFLAGSLALGAAIALIFGQRMRPQPKGSPRTRF